MGRLYDATYGWLFALGYDRLLAESERAGLEDVRRRLLARAAGATLEIGAGTGLNLAHYPGAVTDLILAEPSPHMARRLVARRDRSSRHPQIIVAPADTLPFPDASFDTVVATLVLCTVPDPAAALVEIRRTLRPDGRLLLLEHVRSPDPRVAQWQDRLHRPWRALTAGCHCNRDLEAALAASSFHLEEVSRGSMPKAPAFVAPLIVAVAVPEVPAA